MSTRYGLAAGLLAVSTLGQLSAGTWTASSRSIGPLSIGMSVTTVRQTISDPGAYLIQALHQDHSLPKESDNSACGYLLTTKVPQDIGLMFQAGTLVRADVWGPGVRTAEGAMVGDSEDQLRKLFGAGLQVEQSNYPPVGAHYVIVPSSKAADREYDLLFETVRGLVTRFRIGLKGAVAQTEGCA